MNNLKEVVLERLINCGKERKRLKTPVIMLITLFLILFHGIRNFFMQLKVHSFRRRIFASTLCVCLIISSTPDTYYTFPVLAAENSEDVQENMPENIQENSHEGIYEIVSFTELPDEVKEQTVAVGTPLENLELPDTLTALCRMPNEKNPEDNKDSDKEQDSEKEDKTDEGKEENPEGDSEEETENESEDSDNEDEENDDESGDSDNEDEENEDESGDSGNEDEGNEDESENSGNENEENAENREAVETMETFTVTLRENYAMPNELPEIKELFYEEASNASETESEENGRDSAEGSDTEKRNEETVTIGGITWESLPEYDSDIEGIYLFTPVISDEAYTLAEDVELPEIRVAVAETEIMLAAEDPADEELLDVSGSTTPVCGVISSDTTWDNTWAEGILSDGELIIMPGVTLTLKGPVRLKGTVTIKGGGTILRGSENSYIAVDRDPLADVTIENITIDGASILSNRFMISADGKFTICNGCIIRNCISTSSGGAISNGGSLLIRDTIISNCSAFAGGAISNAGGAVVTMENSSIIDCSADSTGGAIHNGGRAILENTTIENCSAYRGGAICTESYYIYSSTFYEADLTIKDGTFINNKAILTGTDDQKTHGGGCIWTSGILNIYGGEFIGNVSSGRGGCIYQQSYVDEDHVAVINISGGYFEGNTCTNSGYEGSGAICTSYISEEQLILSSNAHFCGDDAFGTDGIMLDGERKVLISDTLNYPATVYVKASEGRVIAEGKDHILSFEEDLKKIKFIDIGESGKKYAKVLDEASNQIKLSQIDGYSITYINNGAQGRVVDDEIYEEGDTVTVLPATGLSREGYRFTGWNTKADGSGDSYQPGDTIEGIGEDITLYAQWSLDGAKYTVEHYLQDVSEDGYTRAEADTESLSGTAGEEVSATPKTYPGFTENTAHASRKESGVVTADGSLVLKLYYDRDVYDIAFDLNGAAGTAPEARKLRYGALLQGVSRPEKPGYTFLGWYIGEPETEGKTWDFDKPVEENMVNESEILYAGWVDDIAPKLMQAEFNEGYKDFRDWLIRKKDLIITVPIIEEGSGVKQADYVLSTLERSDDVNEPDQAQIIEENGRTVAKITISYDFKGTVSMTCSDNAGNISAGKTLTSPGGGAAFIVEDNAPEITFSSKDGSLSDTFYDSAIVTVSVNDEGAQDNADTVENAKITGGIASVTYRLDDNTETAVEGKGFENRIVPSCEFSVKISGAGEHILKITATDHAGNANTSQTRIKIAQKSTAPTNKTPVISVSRKNSPKPDLPTPSSEQFITLADAPQPLKNANPVKDNEPRTGDSSYVEVYATIAMVTGLLYLLLYFTTDKHGMTQEEKEQFLSCLISWAKKGGKPRRLLATAVIFLFLVYYHSIGKCVTLDEKEIRV